MQWFSKTFNQLNANELYDILQLRVDVFVVEQTCYYPDLDDLDRLPGCRHIFAYEGGRLIGYLRCLPPGSVFNGASAIGRVVINKAARGRQLGHQLIQQGISNCTSNWPDNAIQMGAQCYLEKFYRQYDFTVVSEPFLEDGIPHVGMRREATPNNE
jgi:ElaA protein